MTATDQITEPGVYDIPAEVYHADPVPGGSLSHTGARLLLPPNCPAKFRWWRDNSPEPKREFDFGHAAHRVILGAGQDLAIIEADNYLTKAAKEAKRAAYDAGLIPVLAHEHEQVLAMAAAVKEHPIAGPLFDPTLGQPERSLFWLDEPSGVWRRARLDWLPDLSIGSRLILPDYKTGKTADPGQFSKAIHDHGYHQQAAWYIDAARALNLAEQVAYVLVVQEKTPPYLVNVIEPDHMALRIGRFLNRTAIQLYQQCSDSDTWPGYSDDVEKVGLPPWAENQYGEEVW
jgi:hypothetical protein